MALSATFTANFASFYDAVDKADAKLKDFGEGADKVGGRLTTLANQFSGRKIVQEATIAAKAVEEVGGVSKLTEGELEKLGRTAQEAAEKMGKLGMDVPPQIQAIADAAKGAKEQTSIIGDVADAIGPKILAAFSIGAIADWAKSTIDAASHIQDLSSKLDVSKEAIQRWGYAASLSGASIDDVAAALAFMNKTLDGGSDSTVAALKAAGLAFKDIRAMNSEDAFNAIVEAIQKIPDPMTQARVATELLGKGAQDLLPAIRDGFKEVGAEAAVMSDEVIAANNKIGASWTTLKGQAAVFSANLITLVSEGIDQYMGQTQETIDKTVKEFETSLDHATSGAVARHAAAMGDLVPKLKDADKAYAAFGDTNKENEKKIDVAAAAQEQHTKKIQALADTLTGTDITRKQEDLAEAIKKAGGEAKITAEQTKALGKELDDIVTAGGHLNPQLIGLHDKYLKLHSILPDVAVDMKKLFDRSEDLAPSFLVLNERADHFGKFVKEFSTKDIVQQTGTLIAVLDEEAKGWDETRRRAKKADDEIEERHNEFVKTIQGYGVTLIDGLVSGWDSFKEAGHRVLDDILHYMESVFVKKMLEYFGLVETGGSTAFAGLTAASAESTSAIVAQHTAASAATTATWVSALATIGAVALGVVATLAQMWMIYSFIKAAFSPHITPPTPTPTSPPPDIPANPEPGSPSYDAGLAYAQQLFDQGQRAGAGQEVMQAFIDYMYTHPEFWGKGNGFATGTHGKYLNFGAGTPVMLHGWEAIVPRAKSGAFATVNGAPVAGGAGAVNVGGVTLNLQASSVDEAWLRRGGARQIADAVATYLGRSLGVAPV
jgi:hypothetical protein